MYPVARGTCGIWGNEIRCDGWRAEYLNRTLETLGISVIETYIAGIGPHTIAQLFRRQVGI